MVLHHKFGEANPIKFKFGEANPIKFGEVNQIRNNRNKTDP